MSIESALLIMGWVALSLGSLLASWLAELQQNVHREFTRIK